MTFDEVLAQVRELLQSKGRVAYRALKRRFDLDDEYLEDLKSELIKAEGVAADENGEVLVWTGAEAAGEKAKGVKGEDSLASRVQSRESEDQGHASTVLTLDARRQTLDAAAERRQLTVMFCDLVGSTALSAQLDPEEYREVVRAYQEMCTGVIRRYEGYIAQHLGDGLLVYFGYPTAHEDDAVRAVRAGLEIITALRSQVPSPLVGEVSSSPSPFQGEGRGEGSAQSSSHTPHPNLLPQGEKELRRLQVRIGIHTGLVVIGEIGSSEKREILALGETPNLAARIQGQAHPDEVMISAATYRLVEGLFACEDRGQPELKGITTPLTLHRVVQESEAHSRFDVAVQAGLTPLVGREEELALVRRRWEQAIDGEGQVVLLSGEAGIGKSRLVQEIKDRIGAEGAVRIEFRCSPYHHNSALYPIIDHLQRLLRFAREDSSGAKLKKLEEARVGAHSRAPLPPDAVPLLAALLSLPHPEDYPPITLSPQKQKERTHEALVAWLIAETKQHTVCTIWEDLHWADPSTLEFLALCLDQAPTARMLMLLTFRPEFTPAWASRSHVSHLVLSRLGRKQTSAIVEQIIGGRALPSEVLQQIVAKTDGVPLFVEELTKSVIESVGSTESIGSEGKLGRAPLQFAIPATLKDALMARLDRLGTAKEVAQQGAVVGRELTYELLRAISPLSEAALQQELSKLVEAELLYQRGLPPQATYLFKHALVQETAYQSLLKSKRQQYHRQIAQVLEERFPEIRETQPELLAHHYTEASIIEQAIPCWQRAGQKAVERSAHVEALSHLTWGLELLKTLPDTPERIQQELVLQINRGASLMATRGYAAPEVEHAYSRARELCQSIDDTLRIFPVSIGLWRFYATRAEHQTARELAEQLLSLARQTPHHPARLLGASQALGMTLVSMGEFTSAREHLEQGIVLYNPQQHRRHAFRSGQDAGVVCLGHVAWDLWALGYPEQARHRLHEMLSLAEELSHPLSLTWAKCLAAIVYQFRREEQKIQEQVEVVIRLSHEHGFTQLLAQGIVWTGWLLVEKGQEEEGIRQIHQGLDAHRATGAEIYRPYFLALLAEAYGKVGQIEEGLTALAEALAFVDKTGECYNEAELYRLKGELTLQSSVQRLESRVKEAEECFLKAIEITRRQQAKSLELRATTSLARLWQQQGKQREARTMLSEIYHWFTEGFDTKDLQEAKALLDSPESRV